MHQEASESDELAQTKRKNNECYEQVLNVMQNFEGVRKNWGANRGLSTVLAIG